MITFSLEWNIISKSIWKNITHITHLTPDNISTQTSCLICIPLLNSTIQRIQQVLGLVVISHGKIKSFSLCLID